MIENEKLKLENRHLTDKQSRFERSQSENESDVAKLRAEIKRLTEENTDLKFSQRQDINEKDSKIKELEKQTADLKEQCGKYKTLEALSKERLKAYANQHIKGATGSNVDAQRRLIKDLLNYRNPTGDKNSSFDAKDIDGNYRQDDDMISALETPARSSASIFNPSSEEAFMRSSKRNFVMVSKNAPQTYEPKLTESGKDRNVYTGISESDEVYAAQTALHTYSEHFTDKMDDDELTLHQNRLLQSIERRVGGYEPVFCKLDSNNDEILSKTPQIRFRNFVDPKTLNKLNEDKPKSQIDEQDSKENTEQADE